MTKRIIISLLSLFLVLGGVARADVVTGDSGGGGSPSGAAGGDLGGTYPNPTVTATHLGSALPVNQGGTGTTSTLTGIVRGSASAMTAAELSGDVTTSGSNAASVIGSSNLQQPIMSRGGSAAGNIITATTTTGTITSPPFVADGDLELVFIALNNTTSSAFTPPAGWSAVSACNASGNTNQIQVFSHTASSEGATIPAFTWTTNGTGAAWASAFVNAGIDVCVASTGASSATYNATGLTASSINNRIVAVGVQTNNTSNSVKITTAKTGLIYDSADRFTISLAEVSYPITNVTVGAFGFTASGASVWAGAQISLSYVPSTTATSPGALTYNETGAPYLGFLEFSPNTHKIRSDSYSIMIPNRSQGGGAATGRCGIGTYNSLGIPSTLICGDSGVTYVGDGNDNGGVVLRGGLGSATAINGAFTSTTNNISSTSGTITTSTGLIGSTGGGHLSIKGGTAPTLTAGCNGAGSSVAATSNDTRGNFTSQSSAATTCTLHFNVAFGTAPFCHCWDANSSTTPVGCSVGTVNTTDAVFDFASTASRVWGYECIE